MRQTSIYSNNTELGVTTINPGKLNCRVRNGNGCVLTGKNISLIPTPLFRSENDDFILEPGSKKTHFGKNKI